MLEIGNCEVKHLHTFSSEKIGTLWYYIGKVELEGYPVTYTFHFDAEDVWEHCNGEDADYVIDDADIEDAVYDYDCCCLERLTSCKTLEEAIDVANETIRHYNNGAWNTINENEYPSIEDEHEEEIEKALIMLTRKYKSKFAPSEDIPTFGTALGMCIDWALDNYKEEGWSIVDSADCCMITILEDY